jgi:hypothetical protein
MWTVACAAKPAARIASSAKNIGRQPRLHVGRATAEQPPITDCRLERRRRPHVGWPRRYHIHMSVQDERTPAFAPRPETADHVPGIFIACIDRRKARMMLDVVMSSSAIRHRSITAPRLRSTSYTKSWIVCSCPRRDGNRTKSCVSRTCASNRSSTAPRIFASAWVSISISRSKPFEPSIHFGHGPDVFCSRAVRFTVRTRRSAAGMTRLRA